MAGGIAEALITTAAGLIIAIPALVAYRYLRARVDGHVIEMEKEALKLVAAIDRASQTRPGAAAELAGLTPAAREAGDAGESGAREAVA
jgi:biopolymer transport protein ExbB